MSKRDKELFLFDILIAILKIEDYVKNFSEAQSLKFDYKTWDAVIREFEIIGEATNYLIKLNHFSNEKREIVDFRNILIHKYFGIDADEIWDIINNFLNIYKNEILENIDNIPKNIKDDYFNKLIIENKHIECVRLFLEKKSKSKK